VKIASSLCSHSHPTRAAVASDASFNSLALARNACNSSNVAVGVSRSDDSRPIFANGLSIGTLRGCRRRATFQAATRLHRVVDACTPLALDDLSAGVRLTHNQQLVIEIIDNACIDDSEARLSKSPVVFQDVAADHTKVDFHGLANLVNMITGGTLTTDRMSMRSRKSCMVPPFA
jgi:hypothetical protein